MIRGPHGEACRHSVEHAVMQDTPLEKMKTENKSAGDLPQKRDLGKISWRQHGSEYKQYQGFDVRAIIF